MTVTEVLMIIGIIALVTLTVMVVFVGIRMLQVLKNVAQVTDRIDRMTETVEKYIISPFEFLKDTFGDFQFIKKFFMSLISGRKRREDDEE